MDPYKLLSRSTKLSKTKSAHDSRQVSSSVPEAASRKRKRTLETGGDAGLDFFGNARGEPQDAFGGGQLATGVKLKEENIEQGNEESVFKPASKLLASDEDKVILKRHKLKVTWLNPPLSHRKSDWGGKPGSKKSIKHERLPLFPIPVQAFSDLQTRFKLHPRLAENVAEEGYETPTEVQVGALSLLMGTLQELFMTLPQGSRLEPTEMDLLTVAPTGSGKTLAFMIPLIHRLLQDRRQARTGGSVSAIILAPTKELAGQIVNEGRKLARNTGIKLSLVRKGVKIAADVDTSASLQDRTESPPIADSAIAVKSHILVSTPGILTSIIENSAEGSLSRVQHLIMDEADVLLDPLFREQTLQIWHALTNPDLRVSLWSATMGSNIEELAVAVLTERRKALQAKHNEGVGGKPIVRLVVGLKDSAIPNLEHRLIYAASEQGKLMGLRQLLHPSAIDHQSGPPLLPPFLVFTQTIERAIALHSELLYDIPAEAGGISRIAVLHSDLSDTARDSVMTRFRKGEIWVLITTDLLSRGVDFRGVNGVVNYDIPNSSAAYVHRVGRAGRAGREGGVAVTLYSKDDIPYLKQIANVIAISERQRTTAGASSVQDWLLDALPNLGKSAKNDLKKRGIEARRSRGMQKDPKAARRARISTKSGFVRREENRRQGAIDGSRRRQDAVSESGEETDFGGFE